DRGRWRPQGPREGREGQGREGRGQGREGPRQEGRSEGREGPGQEGREEVVTPRPVGRADPSPHRRGQTGNVGSGIARFSLWLPRFSSASGARRRRYSFAVFLSNGLGCRALESCKRGQTGAFL